MIAVIDDHRRTYGVEPICRVLPIAPSTYHAHASRRGDPANLSIRARRDAALLPEVKRVFDENFQVYGVRKVWRQMKRERRQLARCTVARLMRSAGLRGVIRGKPMRTTVADKAAPCRLDHVNRIFRVPAPNMLWLSDFTYVSTWSGFVYVAFVSPTRAASSAGACRGPWDWSNVILPILPSIVRGRRGGAQGAVSNRIGRCKGGVLIVAQERQQPRHCGISLSGQRHDFFRLRHGRGISVGMFIEPSLYLGPGPHLAEHRRELKTLHQRVPPTRSHVCFAGISPRSSSCGP